MIWAVTDAGGDGDDGNEDWVSATDVLVVCLDGLTSRGESGCVQGVHWYVERLGEAPCAECRQGPLKEGVARAILDVNAQHPQCDLAHPGTPAAAVGILRITDLEYLTLGDITLVLCRDSQVEVIGDERINQSAASERADADRYPIGSQEKIARLRSMKERELASRNHPGGYWVAAATAAAAAARRSGGPSWRALASQQAQ